MTPDLAELRRLAESATPGPWFPVDHTDVWNDATFITGCHRGGVGVDWDEMIANAAFIAAAREAVPALLDQIDTLTRERTAKSELAEIDAQLEAELVRRRKVCPEPPATMREPKPVGYRYELARSIQADRTYTDWQWHLTTYEPYVPPGSIRNLEAVYLASALTAAEAGRADMRERAAKVADEFARPVMPDNPAGQVTQLTGENIAAAIRALPTAPKGGE